MPWRGARAAPGLSNRSALLALAPSLLATADQIFTHDLTLAFLSSLRRWAKDKLDARHASTPQIHVYINGCGRELAPDVTPARWHYLYSLTRGETPGIRLSEEDGLPKKRLGIARTTCYRLGFNQLLVHGALRAYGLDGPKRAAEPLKGTILLHGYHW